MPYIVPLEFQEVINKCMDISIDVHVYIKVDVLYLILYLTLYTTKWTFCIWCMLLMKW